MQQIESVFCLRKGSGGEPRIIIESGRRQKSDRPWGQKEVSEVAESKCRRRNARACSRLMNDATGDPRLANERGVPLGDASSVCI